MRGRKLFVFVVLCFVAGASLLFAHTEGGSGKAELKRPPKSLDKYYPPHSRKFEFTSAMYLMSRAFTATFLYLEKGDKEKAVKWAKKLYDTYVNIPKMVPEWKDYVKEDVAKGFLDAVKKGDRKRISEFADKLGNTCNSCHKDNLLSVKVFYYTPDWYDVKVEDPVEMKKISLHKLMRKMTNSMKLTLIGVEDGDFALAQKAVKDFVARARAVKETCSGCHTEKASVEALSGQKYISSLEGMKNAVLKKDTQSFWKNFSTVVSYCTKCHNVHQTPWLLKSELE